MQSYLPAGGVTCLAAFTAALVGWIGCAPPSVVDKDAAVAPGGPFPVAVDPPIDAENVLIDKVIRVTFDDHLDNGTLAQSRFALHSGPVQLWVTYYYDPVRRQLVVWPSRSMLKRAKWLLDLDKGIAGLDGTLVVPGTVARFYTGEEAGDNTPFIAPSFEKEIMPIFIKRCSSCHGGSAGKELAGLRLDSKEALLKTALNIGSDGWPGWHRITPASPGESYLLYKIIGDERIAGVQMPRTLTDKGKEALPLTAAEQEALSLWIASGAPFFDPEIEDE